MNIEDILGLEANATAYEDCNSFSSSMTNQSGNRKRTSSTGTEGAPIKLYKCRFCPARFSKSQALGGHMNRHRQERETEQIFHAQELLSQKGLPAVRTPCQNASSSFTPKVQMQKPISSMLNQSEDHNTGVSFQAANKPPESSILPSNFNFSTDLNRSLNAQTDAATRLAAEGIFPDTHAQAVGNVGTLCQPLDYYIPWSANIEDFELPGYQQQQFHAYSLSSNYNHLADFNQIPIQRTEALSSSHVLHPQYEASCSTSVHAHASHEHNAECEFDQIDNLGITRSYKGMNLAGSRTVSQHPLLNKGIHFYDSTENAQDTIVGQAEFMSRSPSEAKVNQALEDEKFEAARPSENDTYNNMPYNHEYF